MHQENKGEPDMTSTITINKLLKTTDGEGDLKAYFFIQIRWLDHQVLIKLQDTQSNKCYQGTLTTENLKETAGELDVPYNDYCEECRLALTTYIALPGFNYKLDDDENILKIWKTQADSIPMLFLEIPLKLVRTNYDILDSAIEELQNQNKTLTDRVQKAHKFDQNSRELLDDYRLCVEDKNQLERKLLRKVAVLLNTKKQKISDLEERLRKYESVNEDSEEYNENMDETDADSRPHSSSRKRALPQTIDSDTEDEDFMANTEPMTLPENL